MTLISTTTELTAYPTSIHDSPTLLPENMASFVTAASLAARLSLRCSSIFVEALFEAAKYGTVLSLGLSRQTLTNALATAKQLHTLTYDKSAGELEESGFLRILEKYTSLGIYVVHSTFTLAELFALSGLQLTSQTVKSGLKTAEESVRIIDGIFGSNETSRAIASIVTLVHRELMQDPDFELAKGGKVAILAGLTKALTTFAVLQYVTHKRTMKQVKVTPVWEGLVPDDEDDSTSPQQHVALVPFRNPSKDVICELERVLVNGMETDMEACDNSPYSAYDIATTTRFTTTTTTRIQPIDANTHLKPKHVIVQAEEEREDTFIATVESSPGNMPEQQQQQQQQQRQIVLVRPPPRVDSGFVEAVGDAGDRVILSNVSQKFTSQTVQRQEWYGDDGDMSGSVSKRRPTYWNQRTHSEISERHNKKQRSIVRQRRSSTSSVAFPSFTSKDQKDTASTRVYRSHSISSTNYTLTSYTPVQTSDITTTTTTIATTAPSPPSAPAASSSTFRPAASSNILAEIDNTHFPPQHLISNIARFMRYASAAYGESFMRILGIGNIPSVLPASHHPNHHVFAHHTGVSIEDILLSSYTDRSLLTMNHPSIHELVHYVTVDHAAQAIVLTCRGTLGLSDVLTDLTCHYSDVTIDGETGDFRAHCGMWDAAQLLAKKKGNVFRAIREGLMLYPRYGLVLCGHSLGGGVASLVGVLWSKKKSEGEGGGSSRFVLSSSSGLPPGRPIHCYVYGPPCVMSLDMSKYCHGLVTSVVHGYDIVSCLSLGLLRDFKNVAVSLQAESHVTDEILARVVGRCCDQRRNNNDNDDDDWFWAIIKTMRADMLADKLYPPSAVYLIEMTSQFDPATARKANRVKLSRCRDLQGRFSEIKFSRTMLLDHSPVLYEKAIRQLCRGFSGKEHAYEDL